MATMNRQSEFGRGWKILPAALLGAACGASMPYNAIGFLLGPLHEAFGWSYRDLSLGITLFAVAVGLLAPLCGMLVDRYGVRLVALTSLFASGVWFAAFSVIPPNLTVYLAFWLVLGVLGLGTTPVTWTRGVSLWFTRRRGLALGIALMNTSLAVIVVPRLTVFGMDAFGWRLTFPLLAMLPVFVALPVCWVYFREPTPEERLVGAAVDSKGSLPGMRTREALSDYRFWLLFASVVIVSFAYAGVHVHFAEILISKGFTRAGAANVVAVFGVTILVGRLGTGFLLDLVWAPWVAFPLLSAPTLACIALAGDSVTLPIAIAAAVAMGLACGAETDLIAYLAGRYFGLAHYGKIYGLLYMPFAVAAALSLVVYGWVRDETGSYDLILRVAAGLFLGGALLLLLLGRYPVFEQPEQPEEPVATRGQPGPTPSIPQ